MSRRTTVPIQELWLGERVPRVERLDIADAWLVDPWSGREGPGSIQVRQGRIARSEWRRRGGEVPDVIVAPGFLDLHAHFREPGGEDAETIASGLAAAAHGGFTGVCLMPNTDPPVDSAAAVGRIHAAIAATRSPVRGHVVGAITEGRRGERLSPMAGLAAAGAVGFSDDGSPVDDPRLLRSALLHAGALGGIVVEHPDERALTRGAEANEGLASTILGLRGAPPAAEAAAVSRALAVLADVVHQAPRGVRPRLHLTHLSTADSVDLVRRAKAQRLPVTCDVTPHHLALHEGWVGGDRRYAWQVGDRPWGGGPAEAPPYDAATRVNPPLRSVDDARALAAGLRDGTIDAIATDHAPHRDVDKSVEFGEALPGISGIETAVGLLLAAVEAQVLDLMTVVRALSAGPVQALGEVPTTPRATRDDPADRGFGRGALADLVVVERRATWTVTPGGLLSKGRNTPLMGRSLPGRVLLTIAAGQLAYLDGELAAAGAAAG